MVFLPQDSNAQNIAPCDPYAAKFNATPEHLIPAFDCSLQMQPSPNVILVQVNPGETFSIHNDGTYRTIAGPAQVPMVLHNGAIPPIYVPPGYISRVIEENGVRRVVVLPGGSPGMEGHPAYVTTPALQHHLPIHSFHPSHSMPPIYPQVMPSCRPEVFPYFIPEDIQQAHPDTTDTSISSSEEGTHSTGALPTMHQQARNLTHERLQKKMQERRQQAKPTGKSGQDSSSTTSSPTSPSSFTSSHSAGSDPQAASFSNGNPHQCGDSTQNLSTEHMHPSSHRHQLTIAKSFPTRVLPQFVVSQGEAPDAMKRRGTEAFDAAAAKEAGENAGCADSASLETIPDLLNSLDQPKVRDLKPRSACVVWSPVATQKASDGLRAALAKAPPVSFELHLSHKKKEPGKFHVVYSGTEKQHQLNDLRPASEYQIKLLAFCEPHRGKLTEAAAFQTPSCEPEAPAPPKVSNRTKNSLVLKWVAPADNGERISKYHLEWDEGVHGSEFRHLFSNSQKQHKVTKLQPAHSYRFRLAAENKIGRSPWSVEVTYPTSSTVPSCPDSPRLVKATVKSLQLEWQRATADVATFTLEMNDEATGYGFRPVYDGVETTFCVKGLSRSSHYKFRLCCHNNEGRSKWSETVSYLTCPDKPQPPGKPKVKGNVHAKYFKVIWDAPKDNGGSEVNKYNLEMCRERLARMEVIYAGQDQETLVENLDPGSTYRLRVFCQTNGGLSHPSEVAMVTTLPVVSGACAAPMLALRPKPTCLTVKWDPPQYNGGTPVTQYEVSCSPVLPSSEEESIVHKGPEQECTVGSLSPGRQYSFRVRPINKIGTGPWSEPLLAITSPGNPDKVEAPSATALSPTSVHVQWQEPVDNGAEISGYRVHWGSTESAMSVLSLGPTLTHVFPKLGPDTEYFFAVQAVNIVGQGSVSEVATIVTPPSCPDQVLRVREAVAKSDDASDPDEDDSPPLGITAHSSAIAWDPPADNGSDITCYKIHSQERSSRSSRRTDAEQTSEDSVASVENGCLFEVDGNVTLFCIEDLKPDTQYSVKVCAVNQIGCGCFSEPLHFRTRALPPGPPKLTCVQSGPSSLKLKWQESRSGDDRYLLQMRDRNGRFSTIYRGSGSAYRVHRLAEDTTYRFRINASNSEGEGQFSGDFAFSTLVQMPPVLDAPLASAIDSTSCELSWQKAEPIKGDILRYKLSLERADDPASKLELVCDKTRYTLGQLSPATEYKIRLSTIRSYTPLSTGATSSSSTDDSSSTSSESPEEVATELQSAFSAACVITTLDGDDEPRGPPCLTAKDVASVAKRESPLGASPLYPSGVETPKICDTEKVDQCEGLISEKRISFVLLALFFVSAIILAFAAQLLLAD